MESSIESSFQNKIKFKPENYKHDQGTYSGRLMTFFEIFNPRRFFLTNSRIDEAYKKVEKFNIRQEVAKNLGQDIYLTQSEIDELIENQKIVGSAIHPDTKEKIFRPFRMCGNAICNTPLLFLSLTIKPKLINLITVSWMNQSYNAGVNYSNRNASSPGSRSDIIRGYSGAVLSSTSILYILTEKVFVNAAK